MRSWYSRQWLNLLCHNTDPIICIILRIKYNCVVRCWAKYLACGQGSLKVSSDWKLQTCWLGKLKLRQLGSDWLSHLIINNYNFLKLTFWANLVCYFFFFFVPHFHANKRQIVGLVDVKDLRVGQVECRQREHCSSTTRVPGIVSPSSQRAFPELTRTWGQFPACLCVVVTMQSGRWHPTSSPSADELAKSVDILSCSPSFGFLKKCTEGHNNNTSGHLLLGSSQNAE